MFKGKRKITNNQIITVRYEILFCKTCDIVREHQVTYYVKQCKDGVFLKRNVSCLTCKSIGQGEQI